jgi:hypothetical protein
VTHISYLVSVQKVYLHAYSGSFNDMAGAVLELSDIQCLGWSNDSFNFKSGSVSSLFQYSITVTSPENPVSQTYIVGKGIRYFTTLSYSSGYPERMCSQNLAGASVWRLALKNCHTVRLSCSSDVRCVITACPALTKGLPILFYLDSGTGKYSCICTWRICMCSLM